jgi:hypothetical protein
VRLADLIVLSRGHDIIEYLEDLLVGDKFIDHLIFLSLGPMVGTLFKDVLLFDGGNAIEKDFGNLLRGEIPAHWVRSQRSYGCVS